MAHQNLVSLLSNLIFDVGRDETMHQ